MDEQYRALLPAQGHGRDSQAGRRGRAANAHRLRRRRQSPVLSVRRAPADHPQADRKFPGLTSACCRRTSRTRISLDAAKSSVAPSSACRSLPMSGRAPFGCKFSRRSARFTPRCRKPARAKRACRRITTGPDRDRFQCAVSAGFSARGSKQDQVAFHFKDQKSAGELRPGGDGTQVQVPLRRDADANLKYASVRTRMKQMQQTTEFSHMDEQKK